MMLYVHWSLLPSLCRSRSSGSWNRCHERALLLEVKAFMPCIYISLLQFSWNWFRIRICICNAPLCYTQEPLAEPTQPTLFQVVRRSSIDGLRHWVKKQVMTKEANHLLAKRGGERWRRERNQSMLSRVCPKVMDTGEGGRDINIAIPAPIPIIKIIIPGGGGSTAQFLYQIDLISLTEFGSPAWNSKVCVG